MPVRAGREAIGRRAFLRRAAAFAAMPAMSVGCGRARRRFTLWSNSRDVQSLAGLRVIHIADMRADERGGNAVVVLHGFGVPGDSLVPFAAALKRPGRRFFVPAGLLSERDEDRAWWEMDPNVPPVHADSDRLPPGFQPAPAVVAARGAVQALIAKIIETYAPATVAVVGHSQGAMLALDVGLARTPGVDRVVAMSGVLMTDSVPALTAPHAAWPRFFLAHGQQDARVPFAAATRARELLAAHGVPVTWRPFDGGHAIPDALLPEIERFLFI